MKGLYGEHDPYKDLNRRPLDLHGWGYNVSLYQRLVRQLKPSVIVEVGVWKGATTCALADALRTQQGRGLVVAIDTWSGAPEFWTLWTSAALSREMRAERDLQFVNGYPSVYYTFLSNVAQLGLSPFVLPFPVPSAVAWHVFKAKGWGNIDLIHIDGSHEYREVQADLQMWWELVRPGGCLLCDDYGVWPMLTKAVDDFARQVNVSVENLPNAGGKRFGGKGVIFKPKAGAWWPGQTKI